MHLKATLVHLLSHNAENPADDCCENALIPMRQRPKRCQLPGDEERSRHAVILGQQKLVHQHHRDGDDEIGSHNEGDLDLFSQHDTGYTEISCRVGNC